MLKYITNKSKFVRSEICSWRYRRRPNTRANREYIKNNNLMGKRINRIYSRIKDEINNSKCQSRSNKLIVLSLRPLLGCTLMPTKLIFLKYWGLARKAEFLNKTSSIFYREKHWNKSQINNPSRNKSLHQYHKKSLKRSMNPKQYQWISIREVCKNQWLKRTKFPIFICTRQWT